MQCPPASIFIKLKYRNSKYMLQNIGKISITLYNRSRKEKHTLIFLNQCNIMWIVRNNKTCRSQTCCKILLVNRLWYSRDGAQINLLYDQSSSPDLGSFLSLDSGEKVWLTNTRPSDRIRTPQSEEIFTNTQLTYSGNVTVACSHHLHILYAINQDIGNLGRACFFATATCEM